MQTVGGWKKLRGRLGFSLSLGIISFLLTLPSSLLDFDGHHEGVMLAPAIVLRGGGTLFTDVFLQYGPVSSWLQGVFLMIWPWGEALGLRVFNSLLVGVLVGLIADLGRVAPESWRLPPTITTAVSLLVLVSWDGFWGIPPLPWSSLVASVLVTGFIHSIARLLWKEESGFQTSWRELVVPAFLIALLPFTRLTVGVVFLLGGASILLIKLASKKALSSKEKVFGGFVFLGLTIILLALVLRGNFLDWWSQSVVWPLDWLQTKDSFAWKIIERFLPWTGGPAIAAVLLPILLKLPRATSIPLVTSLYIYGVLLGALNGRGFGVGVLFPEATSTRWSEILLYFGYSSLSFLYFAGVAGTAIAGLQIGDKFIRHRFLNMPHAVLAVSSLSMLSQSVPVMDTRHFWWALPIPLLLTYRSLAVAMNSNSLLSRLEKVAAGLPIIIIGAGATLTSAGNLFLVERFPYPEKSVAAGLWARPDEVASFQSDLELVTSLPEDSNLIFHISNGHLSVMEGTYLPADPFFVKWGPSPELTRKMSAGSVVIVEDEDSRETLLLDAENRGISIQILGENDRYQAFAFFPTGE